MIKLHHDLLLTIDALKEQIELFEETKTILDKRMNIRKPKDMKAMTFDSEIRGCRDDTTLDRLSPIYIQIVADIEEYKDLLVKHKATKDKREYELSLCKGLQEQVYTLHTIEGLTLQEVADKLDKKHSYIMEVNAKIGKMLNNDK